MLHTRKLWAALALPALICFTATAQDYKGDIVGRVFDSRTQEPVPSAHAVIVERTAVGASADTQGQFTIRDLPVGTYSVRFSAVGYATKIVTNVVVSTGRATPLRVLLEQVAIEAGEVTAEAGYFDRALQISPISTNIVDRAEVLRSPGGVQDVQRVIQNLPGVASSTDNINELIVRGGAPYENLTIMDDMEIPSINHYANQQNSAGPINMVNADMIEDVQFSSGGFPARYGDKTSSVMSLSVREGSREKGFASKTAMNFAGVGTLLEGGFAGGKGSYIFSVRNSLLEVLNSIIGLSSISLTAIPKYWDTQAKVVYDLAPGEKLSFNMLYGDGRILLDGDAKATDPLRKGISDSSAVDRLYPRTRQYAAGLSLRSLFGGRGFSTLTLYASGSSSDVNVMEDFDVRARGGNGEVLSTTTLNSRTVFQDDYVESFAALKYQLFYRIHPQHELSLGFQYATPTNWHDYVFVGADTSRYDLDRNGTFETGPVVVPAGSTSQKVAFGKVSKTYAFVSDEFALTPELSIVGGLRYDGFTYSGQSVLSPRGSISWRIDPGGTLSFSLGEYYQSQPFPYYWDRRNIGYNRSLPDMKADHYVLGYEQVIDRGLKFSVESYYKKYTRTSVSEQFIYQANDTLWSDRNLAVGRRTAYGLELYLEQRQVADFYGTLSLSLSRSRDDDPRIPALTATYPSDYDYPVIFTMIGGRVVKGVRDWLNGTPFYVRYLSYILPLSNEMEISLKYRYQSGRPYTPMTFVAWKQTREGGVQWSRGAWIASTNANGARYPDYSRLDLQWVSRFYFRTWNINVYVALMNVLNTKNVFYQDYRSDGTVETVYQFAFFPVVGLEAEF